MYKRQVFKGTVRDIFITRKEFTGAIYEQIEDAYNFVLQHIDLGSRIEGIGRQDYYEPVSYTHLDVYKRQLQQCLYAEKLRR